jgi:hypothetical protein
VYGSANTVKPIKRPIFGVEYIYLLAIGSPKGTQPGCSEPGKEVRCCQKEEERSLSETYFLIEPKYPENSHR